jgi:hypothetical protein
MGTAIAPMSNLIDAIWALDCGIRESQIKPEQLGAALGKGAELTALARSVRK